MVLIPNCSGLFERMTQYTYLPRADACGCGNVTGNSISAARAESPLREAAGCFARIGGKTRFFSRLAATGREARAARGRAGGAFRRRAVFDDLGMRCSFPPG